MKELKRNKGFTIIELIVVIAVIGILVLMAAPKFLGYTADAKVSQIKNDIKAYEIAIGAELVNDESFMESWGKISKENLTKHAEDGKLHNVKDFVKSSDLKEETYYSVQKDKVNVKSKLKGDFYISEKGKVYYYDKSLNNDGGEDNTNPPTPDLPKYKVTFLGLNDEVIEIQTVEEGSNAIPPAVDKHINDGMEEFDGWDKPLDNITQDIIAKVKYKSVFEWVKNSFSGYIGLNGEKGHFKYVGTGQETVTIPHVIQGIPMTSYYKMFYGTGADVKKVVSTNTEVTNMGNMFWSFQGKESLDLSNFNTENVTHMYQMFLNSQATSLDLSNFNTSKVTSMSNMFSDSQATSIIGLDNFNTEKVTTMSDMFSDSKAKSLDLSNFNTEKVTSMSSMFRGSQAITGYARTQEDADKFNASSTNKPIGLTFIVGKP